MQQINLRQLRRDIRHGADGRLVFPGMTEITDGVVTSGGKLAYADNGTDIQTQLDAVVASVAAIDVHGHVQENVCYVDSKRVDSEPVRFLLGHAKFGLETCELIL